MITKLKSRESFSIWACSIYAELKSQRILLDLKFICRPFLQYIIRCSHGKDSFGVQQCSEVKNVSSHPTAVIRRFLLIFVVGMYFHTKVYSCNCALHNIPR